MSPAHYLTDSNIKQLKGFIQLLKINPQILYHDDLEFFRSYLHSLHAKLPEREHVPPPNPEMSMPTTKLFDSEPESVPDSQPAPQTKPGPEKSPKDETPKKSATVTEENEESDVELDNTGVIAPDNDEPQPMGDPNKESSEEDLDKADDLRRQAMDAFGQGEIDNAIDFYTKAIELNPGSAIFFAKRSQCYLQREKPRAAIRDCDRALEINPDSAAAYKFRGRAFRLLGKWEEAAKDLRNACKLDFDEQTDEWLREVTPNARKLEEHQRKLERRRAEKEIQEKMERARKAREEHAKAAASAAEEPAPGNASGPGGPGMADFYKFFNDPEIMTAFQDPEVSAAFQDISTNPANIIKYQSNPKIAALISKLSGKFGGRMPGGMGGGMGGMPGFGGMGGFPGAGGAPPNPSSRPSNDDAGLD